MFSSFSVLSMICGFKFEVQRLTLKIEEYLTGSQKSKSFSGPVLQSLHGGVDLLLCDGGEVPVLGEVLPDQPVGVLVGAALPCRITDRAIGFMNLFDQIRQI